MVVSGKRRDDLAAFFEHLAHSVRVKRRKSAVSHRIQPPMRKHDHLPLRRRQYTVQPPPLLNAQMAFRPVGAPRSHRNAVREITVIENDERNCVLLERIMRPALRLSGIGRMLYKLFTRDRREIMIAEHMVARTVETRKLSFYPLQRSERFLF